jgi:hypothetical protein
LAFFAILCTISVVLVERFGTIEPADLEFLDLAFLGLGTFRLVHLLTYDKIFDIVRNSFMDRNGSRLVKADHGWRRLVCEFIECIWCTGMWSGLFAVTIYFLGSWGRFAVIVLAVAGLGSLFQVISKAIAEHKS